MILGRDGKENIWVLGDLLAIVETRLVYRETRRNFECFPAETIQSFLDGTRSDHLSKIEYYLGLERFEGSIMALRHLLEDKGSKDLGLNGLTKRVESYNSENNPMES